MKQLGNDGTKVLAKGGEGETLLGGGRRGGNGRRGQAVPAPKVHAAMGWRGCYYYKCIINNDI